VIVRYHLHSHHYCSPTKDDDEDQTAMMAEGTSKERKAFSRRERAACLLLAAMMRYLVVVLLSHIDNSCTCFWTLLPYLYTRFRILHGLEVRHGSDNRRPRYHRVAQQSETSIGQSFDGLSPIFINSRSSQQHLTAKHSDSPQRQPSWYHCSFPSFKFGSHPDVIPVMINHMVAQQIFA
jgi:hypothetical protein